MSVGETRQWISAGCPTNRRHRHCILSFWPSSFLEIVTNQNLEKLCPSGMNLMWEVNLSNAKGWTVSPFLSQCIHLLWKLATLLLQIISLGQKRSCIAQEALLPWQGQSIANDWLAGNTKALTGGGSACVVHFILYISLWDETRLQLRSHLCLALSLPYSPSFQQSLSLGNAPSINLVHSYPVSDSASKEPSQGWEGKMSSVYSIPSMRCRWDIWIELIIIVIIAKLYGNLTMY